MGAFRVSNAAKSDIKKIGHYTQERWGKEQRRIYLKDMQKKFIQLSDNPHMVALNKSFNPPVRLCPFGKNLIVYLIDNEEIYIVRILHGSMDVEELL
jgi:toxin ParE1/3/4